MHITDINADTDRAFFTCLHPEEPEDLVFTAHSRNWYAEHKDKGYKAQFSFSTTAESWINVTTNFRYLLFDTLLLLARPEF